MLMNTLQIKSSLKEVTEVGEQLQRYDETEQHEKHKELVKDIEQKEEQMQAYKRQQKEYKKRINQIETSNTWKLGNLLKPFSSIWNKLFKQSVYDKERIAHLEKEVMKQHEKIERLETELAPLRLRDEQITSFSITQQMRSLKNEGKLLGEINSL